MMLATFQSIVAVASTLTWPGAFAVVGVALIFGIIVLGVVWMLLSSMP